MPEGEGRNIGTTCTNSVHRHPHSWRHSLCLPAKLFTMLSSTAHCSPAAPRAAWASAKGSACAAVLMEQPSRGARSRTLRRLKASLQTFIVGSVTHMQIKKRSCWCIESMPKLQLPHQLAAAVTARPANPAAIAVPAAAASRGACCNATRIRDGSVAYLITSPATCV